MNTPKVTFFADNVQLVNIFGADIILRLKNALASKGQASLVVSGGSTPKSLFLYLSGQELDWSKVTITLADERCLPQSHTDSNARLIREHLLIGNAAKARFLPLFEDDETPDIAAENAAKKVSQLGTYDVVILGMGTDGHTASLFPQAPNLPDGLADDAPACLPIDPVTNPMMRVTQSKARLLDAEHIFFHLAGENKLDTLDAVLADSDKNIYPSAHFIHQSAVPVNIYFARNK